MQRRLSRNALWGVVSQTVMSHADSRIAQASQLMKLPVVCSGELHFGSKTRETEDGQQDLSEYGIKDDY